MAKAPSKPTIKKTVGTKTAQVKTKAAPAKKTSTKKSVVTNTTKTVGKSAKMPARKTAPAKRTAPIATKKPTSKVSPTTKSKTKLASKTSVSKSAPAKKVTVVKAKAPLTPKKVVAAKPSKGAASLQAKLDDVAKRLIAAETQTKKNVAALEADFTALAAQMGRTKAGQTRLTKRVTELSKTLTKDLEGVQSDIRRDLSGVLQNPTLDQLQHALNKAEARLEESETAQDVAIARINRHIADIATIVEERLSNETAAREAAMAEMKREMSSDRESILAAQAALKKTQDTQDHAGQLRFSNLQSESADAIRSLGDKLVDVAEEMGRRRETLAGKLRQEQSESTLTANTEFEQFRRVMERRLEALETEVTGFDSQIDRAVAPLASRLEGLEYGLTRAPENTHQDYAPALQAAPPMTSPLSAPANPVAAAEAVSAPNHLVHQPLAEDAFSPAPAPTQLVSAPIVAANETPLELDEPAPALAVPYNPEAYPSAVAYQAPEAVQPPAQPYGQALEQIPYDQAPNQPIAGTLSPSPYGADIPNQYATPEYNNPAEHFSAPVDYAPVQPPFPTAEDLSVADADLPYADPAYAEGGFEPVNTVDESMSAARPGAFDGLKKIGRKAKSPKNSDGGPSALSTLMTPRNLKLGGLVAALGVASFIGVQALKDGKAPASNPEFSVANNAALDGNRPVLGGILPPNTGNQRPSLANLGGPVGGAQITQETIGQYADNRQAPLITGGEDALNTAAQAGNPIAQLQLGLSQIENGQLDSGVKLIRTAANQDQPAALYRLAKLYETGEGVGQDAKTARELTERAARGGNRIAMHDLALYYAEGRGGVDVDMPTAAKWFEKAAERGVVDSQFNLGVLFESGEGLPQDMESALMWYSIAGTQGDQMAAGRVGILRQNLNPDQLTRADKRISAFAPSRIDEEANGIFNNVPWAAPAKVVQSGANKANVVQTQTLLNELGYAVGAADGAIGPKTKNAIMNFQRNSGLNETGTVNAELIERLESAAGA